MINKKILGLIFGCSLLLSSVCVIASELDSVLPVSVSLNGFPVSLNQELILRDDSYYVPLREVNNVLGMETSWNPETNVITVNRNGSKIDCKVGSDVALVNGEPRVSLPPIKDIAKGITYVPIRFISEIFGIFVDFDNVSKVIKLHDVNLSDFDLSRLHKQVQ